MDDHIDIELRSAADVARRAVVVSAVLQRISLDEISRRNDIDAAGEAFDLREWIVTERLADTLTPSESQILLSPVGGIPREARLDVSWQSEALGSLLWALGVSELPSIGHQPELASLLDAVPQPWDRVSGWVDGGRLRPESEIAHEREVADIWYWRLGAEIARRAAPHCEQLAFERAIREVVAESHAAGYTIDAAGGDFAVAGRLIRDLTAAELDKLAATAEERLRALNWISGFGSSWADVPLEV
jgi:Domain of unknown function (DUF4272)